MVPAAQDRPPGYDDGKGKGGYSYQKGESSAWMGKRDS